MDTKQAIAELIQLGNQVGGTRITGKTDEEKRRCIEEAIQRQRERQRHQPSE